ncbi:pyridoxal phosphate-dependent aminotransferase [Stratiformator vulcanicus]|uniref:Aminotransferase n=1 Tax=Stratiformator vulcanicus TaxID=2527980 RepID=A0A517QVV1_9PLAN|nr:aminotransferase class I/II-fold pyridoxal phosphate-dependent enzyme [Stratiformator vulcanicus]QDT35789.1 Putative N-acetyl-LL-diaminopimelate aminotransferase [Stratiformator vulcanicus]
MNFSTRAQHIDASGIRKVFDLAATMSDPINLSIGQPHFDTPGVIKQAIHQAIDDGRNAYSQSQGVKPLIERIQADVDRELEHDDRRAFICSGTSGGLMLSLMVLVDPGDEVIVFDPYFVMYKHLTTLCGGKPVLIDTYPDFRIDLDKVRSAITPRTKAILCNSPANPTGAVLPDEDLKGLADLAAEKGIALISDEIYRAFQYDSEFVSPAKWNPDTIVIDGFSKTYSMTGHRVGWVHGPEAVIQQMIKLQQFTFVCAPHPMQWGALAACDFDVSDHVVDYRRKRDFMLAELGDQYDIRNAGGAFYLFVKAPWGTGTEFVKKAIEHNLLIIPGNVFSEQDTHFRVSYAADDAVLERGVEVLKRLATG